MITGHGALWSRVVGGGSLLTKAHSESEVSRRGSGQDVLARALVQAGSRVLQLSLECVLPRWFALFLGQLELSGRADCLKPLHGTRRTATPHGHKPGSTRIAARAIAQWRSEADESTRETSRQRDRDGKSDGPPPSWLSTSTVQADWEIASRRISRNSDRGTDRFEVGDRCAPSPRRTCPPEP